MDVLVVGAHGQIGQEVTRLLAEHDDHEAYGMVRKSEYEDDIEALGGTAVRGDVTDPDSLDDAFADRDAVVFTAGSAGEDVWGIDRDGANNCVDTAEAHSVDRFVMLSSMGAANPETGPDELREYLEAKAEADEYLRESGLTWTILRPGPLTDDPGTGRIRTGSSLASADEAEETIPREDVATALVTVLPMTNTHGQTIEALTGETPIESALRAPLT
jgi:uncharacterized protein YbjT (DUF2867 family)